MSEAVLCVYCRKQPVNVRWRPFCSERCKLLDLAAWTEGTYRIPAATASPADPDEERADDTQED